MKNLKAESVIHDWMQVLTFQQQALLLTAMRGPDGMPKHCSGKEIVRYLRGVVLKPAGESTGKNDNDFMWWDYNPTVDYFRYLTKAFWSQHDEYPHHFIMHILHCAELIGYKHPDGYLRNQWLLFYLAGCSSFHMTPETEVEMDDRLNDFGYPERTKKQGDK